MMPYHRNPATALNIAAQVLLLLMLALFIPLPTVQAEEGARRMSKEEIKASLEEHWRKIYKDTLIRRSYGGGLVSRRFPSVLEIRMDGSVLFNDQETEKLSQSELAELKRSVSEIDDDRDLPMKPSNISCGSTTRFIFNINGAIVRKFSSDSRVFDFSKPPLSNILSIMDKYDPVKRVQRVNEVSYTIIGDERYRIDKRGKLHLEPTAW